VPAWPFPDRKRAFWRIAVLPNRVIQSQPVLAQVETE
jgi:hypothetical protein